MRKIYTVIFTPAVGGPYMSPAFMCNTKELIQTERLFRNATTLDAFISACKSISSEEAKPYTPTGMYTPLFLTLQPNPDLKLHQDFIMTFKTKE